MGRLAGSVRVNSLYSSMVKFARESSTISSDCIEDSGQTQDPGRQQSAINSEAATTFSVALLTGGGDKPYALGMAAALTSVGVIVDFIGSNDHVGRELLANARVNFHNLRGDQSPQGRLVTKCLRVLNYYFPLLCYVAKANSVVFHMLLNDRIEIFDRTLLMLYYKLLGKRLVLTAHNVDKSKRDGGQSFLNRFSLRWQYRLSDHIFVHTEKMNNEHVTEFGVAKEKVSVIPF